MHKYGGNIDGKTWDVPFESDDYKEWSWKWIRATYWPVKLKWYWDKFLIKIGWKQPAEWLQPHKFSIEQLDRMHFERTETQRKYNGMGFIRLCELELAEDQCTSPQDLAAIRESIKTIRQRMNLPYES
jgi:hypothetical protein